jgi:molecular chaperone GrpE
MAKQKKQTKTAEQTKNEKVMNTQAEGQAAQEIINPSLQETQSATSEVRDDVQDELNKAYNEIKKQLDETTDGWQRERADFSNYKKRIDRERDLQRSMITGDLCKKFLVVLDDLERAMKNCPKDGDGAAWADGVDLVMRKLIGILEMEGIQRIPAETELFDPNRHEAVSSEVSDSHQSGEIIEVLQQGYLIGDRVLRPALVRVAQ